MRYLVASAPDPASMNIRQRLLETAEWEEGKAFQGSPVLELVKNPLLTNTVRKGGEAEALARPGEVMLVIIKERHLYAENLDQELVDARLPEPEFICFLSRHTAASGKPTLTVHPTGNYGSADYGGTDETLSMAAPRWTTGALRCLAREVKAAGLEHGVGFEVTHHGPLCTTPAFYIEIGSDESQWERPAPGLAIARALLTTRKAAGPVLVGAGGGHYAPRFTEVALELEGAFGHIVPAYALKGHDSGEQARRLRMAWDHTPEAEGLYFHRKGLSKPMHRELREWAEGEGLPVFSSYSLEPLGHRTGCGLRSGVFRR